MNENILMKVEKLHRFYGDIAVLNGISFCLKSGFLTLLTGKNGSGKSTLINCISGFDLAYKGRVFLDGVVLDRKSAGERSRLGLSRTFQHPHVFADLTVKEHFLIGMFGSMPVIQSYGKRNHLLHLGDVQQKLRGIELECLWDRPAKQLSYGEMKLVNLIRLIAHRPRVVLLDEPLASLHGKRKEQVLGLLQDMKDNGVALLVVEHRKSELLQISNVEMHLADGELQNHA